MYIFALIACISVDNFDERTVTLTCQRSEECDKGAFEDAYDDQGECQDDVADYYGSLYDCYVENCDFDAQAASSCLSDQRSASCEEWTAGDVGNDCDEVFTDCDEVDFALCFVGA